MYKKVVHWAIVLIVLSFVWAVQAATLTLDSDADTYFRDGRGPFGADTYMWCASGSYSFVGYMRFDLSEMSTITEATLTLHTVSDKQHDLVNNARFAVYGLANVSGNTDQDWDEATLTAADAGDEWDIDYSFAASLSDGRVVNLDADQGADVTEVVPGDYAGTCTLSGPDLVSFLQARADDGGLATFIIAFNDSNTKYTSYGTKEADAEYRPTLEVTGVTGPRTHASLPSPDDGKSDVYQATELSWTPGDYAVSHQVYLSTDVDAVDSGDSAVLVAELTDPVYTPESWLELGTTYYWRVDEVNAPGDDTVYPGSTWSFTVEPVAYDLTVTEVTASSVEMESRPVDNLVNGSGLNGDAHSNDADAMWTSDSADAQPWVRFAFDQPYGLVDLKVWNYNGEYEYALGYSIQDVLVETSLDAETWSVVEDVNVFAQGTGEDGYTLNNHFDLGGLKAQYVRFTALSNYATSGITSVGLSEVQFTGMPLHARVPSPANDAIDVDLDQVLQWRAGRGAVEHRVYFSTDSNAVANRDEAALLDTVAGDELALSDIELDRTYSWAVDAVHDDIIVPGALWSFSTPDCIVIDDMESYSDNEYDRIFDAWQDGYGTDNDNGSQVGHNDPVFAELETVFAGSQSMPYYYDNTRGEQEAWAELDLGGQDWTVGGIGQLSLFFLGERDNEGGELFLEINGKRIVNDVVLNSGIWSQWIIDLSTVSTDLTQVDSLVLGVADEDAKGLLYFDDIILYRQAPVVGSDQAQDPGTTDLELLYSFEKNLDDSSTHGWDASAPYTLFYSESLQEGNLDLGDAISLDGVDGYVVAPESVGNLMAGLSDCTFSAWVSLTEDSTVNWQRVFDFGNGTTDYLFLTPRAATADPPEFGILSSTSASGVEQDVAAGDALSDGWHHLAVVIDDMTLNLYVDGILAGTDVTDTLPQDVGATSNNWLGRSQWDGDGYYDGLLDEFSIYSRPLSMEEVRYLAGAR